MNTRVITSIEWTCIAFAVEKGVLIAKLAKTRTLNGPKNALDDGIPHLERLQGRHGVRAKGVSGRTLDWGRGTPSAIAESASSASSPWRMEASRPAHSKRQTNTEWCYSVYVWWEIEIWIRSNGIGAAFQKYHRSGSDPVHIEVSCL